MAYNPFDDCADAAHVVVNLPPPTPPEDTLLRESISVIKRLPYWKQFAMFFFAIAMVLFPIGINWMNIQMIRGISNGLALVFVGVRACECAIDTFRELFLVKLGIESEVSIIIRETKRYALLSKPTIYCHSAEKVIRCCDHTHPC